MIALAYWVFGQGFGGVLTDQATDVNSGPLLVLMAVLLLGVTEIGPRQHQGAREPSTARPGELPTGSRALVEIT